MILCKHELAIVWRFCFLVPAVVFISFSSPTAATPQTLEQSGITLARSGAHALIIWNATNQFNRYRYSRREHYEILQQIEADALSVITMENAHLKKAKYISVRVEYAQQNSNPSHTRLVTLTVPAKQFRLHNLEWENAVRQGNPPQAVQINDNGPL